MMETKSAENPRVLDALGHLHAEALQPRALDRKAKELIALATSLATGCQTSIAYHLHNALAAGATRAEVVETAEVAVVTLGEPAAVHAANLLRALDLDDAARFAGAAHDARPVPHPYMSPD